MRITIKTFWPAMISLVVVTVLFCLPGDAFPEKKWFEKIFLDKWAHVGLFVVLVLLWSLPTLHRIKVNTRLHKTLMWIALTFIIYGIVIEVVQGRFIPNRSFDIDDMVADAVGCGVGYFLAKRQSKTIND